MVVSKNNLSNNTLALLIVMAIAISVVGTWISLSKITPLTGVVVGAANVTISSSTGISLVVDNVSFGGLPAGGFNDTTDNSPPPFRLRNDGNVAINISVVVSNLWSNASSPTTYYQGRCGNYTTELNCTSVNDTVAFTNLPTSATKFIGNLLYAVANDELEFEINITVPDDEPVGYKNSTVTFTATQAYG